jgi:carboxylesterase
MASGATIASVFQRLRSKPLEVGLRGEGDYGPIDSAGKAPALLALHGFGATPAEVRLLVEAAQELGLRALAPLLPGHGSSVHELAHTRWRDWRAAAEEAFLELSRQAGPVIVGGLSMGSLLTLDLALSHPREVAGIIVLAPAIRLNWPHPALSLAIASALRVPDFFVAKRAPDIRDARQRRQQRTYGAEPVHAGNEVRLAGQRLEKELNKIRCPALIAHGACDHVCPVQNARRVYDGLGTPRVDKELVILPRSFHIITRDVERSLLRARVQGFLSHLLPTQPAAGVSPALHVVPVEP